MLGLEGIRAGGEGGNVMDCLKIIKIRKGNRSQLSKLEKGGTVSDPHGRSGKPPRHSKGQDTGATPRQEGTPRETDTGGHGGGGEGRESRLVPLPLKAAGFPR